MAIIDEKDKPTFTEEKALFKIADTPPAQENDGDEVYDLAWFLDGHTNLDGSRKLF